MPHSQFKRRAHPLSSGALKCPCGQTFDYASERDLNLKVWLHHKVCPNPPEGSENIRMPKKAMMLKEVQHDRAERMSRVHEHH